MNNRTWLTALLMCCAAGLAAGPSGAGEPPVRDRVSFQVDVGADVENDWLVAVLSVTAEDKAPDGIARTINETMNWALRQVQGSSRVRARSGSYQTHPVYDDRKIVRWRGRQELYLESQAVEELTHLVGLLQSRLQVQSLQFSVSPEVHAQVEERLVEQVLAAWQQRAGVVARALNAKRYELVDVSIHTGGGPVMPVHAEVMSMKSGAAVTAPALDSGTSRITVQASGSIRLLRD